MKKYLVALLTIFSLLFFSCASKPEADIPEDINAPLEEALSQAQDTVSEEEEESTNETQTQTETQEVEVVELVSESYPELEELEEPEITDLEYVEETEKSVTGEETQADVNLELIPSEEVLPVVETNTQPENLTVENTEKTDNTIVSEPTPKTELTKKSNTEDDEIIDLENSDTIDIDSIDDEESTVEPEIKIIEPSRKVTLKIGQFLEVTYPGSGWIFMGATDNSKDLTFLGKKLGTENTKFTFSAKVSGTKILHFYKNDSLKNQFLDDYLEVTVDAAKDTTKATVSAPAYKQPVPKKIVPVQKAAPKAEPVAETKTEQVSSNPAAKAEVPVPVQKAKTPAATEASSKETIVEQKSTATEPEDYKETTQPVISGNPKTLLEEAKGLVNNKQYKAALTKLNNFFELATEARDEALYLQGQIYESNSEVKNIKKAIESYRTLTKNYPASIYWDDANKRIIYLTKFYLEGR